ncbi:MAG: phosphomethylpyrimidine synthase ThiC [Candidatus Omnitrophota bacterium]
MTQLKAARAGKITAEMKYAARAEKTDPELLRQSVAAGRTVIPKNRSRRVRKPCAIGERLTTKVNANIGTSKDSSDIGREIRKMREAIGLGADAVMDLSTGRSIRETRKRILASSEVPVGTVPIYEMAIEVLRKGGRIQDISLKDMLAVLETQARDGVDFFTIHAGVTRKALEALKSQPRILDIVSRGGAFLAKWILANGEENPFYSHFDDVLDIAEAYDVTLSLGDGMRPGSIRDATDSSQIAELATLGELQRRSYDRGVQVMIEGPGHVPIHEIEANIVLEKKLCNGAPFYVLGPLVTDIAPGYDHITAAIGGAVAGAAGADFLCYVTPAEHLRLPTIDDVREGVIATKIAAHAADIAKGIGGALERDIGISKARRARDWKGQFALALDSVKPRAYRRRSKPATSDVCTMCSDYCSIKISEECFRRGS